MTFASPIAGWVCGTPKISLNYPQKPGLSLHPFAGTPWDPSLKTLKVTSSLKRMRNAMTKEFSFPIHLNRLLRMTCATALNRTCSSHPALTQGNIKEKKYN
jgi:hypothetical protein